MSTLLSDKIAVMQAAARGEPIEWRFLDEADGNGPWQPIESPAWDWSTSDYRVAQKAKPSLPNGTFWIKDAISLEVDISAQWMVTIINPIEQFVYVNTAQGIRSFKYNTLFENFIWSYDRVTWKSFFDVQPANEVSESKTSITAGGF